MREGQDAFLKHMDGVWVLRKHEPIRQLYGLFYRMTSSLKKERFIDLFRQETVS